MLQHERVTCEGLADTLPSSIPKNSASPSAECIFASGVALKHQFVTPGGRFWIRRTTHKCKTLGTLILLLIPPPALPICPRCSLLTFCMMCLIFTFLLLQCKYCYSGHIYTPLCTAAYVYFHLNSIFHHKSGMIFLAVRSYHFQ